MMLGEGKQPAAKNKNAEDAVYQFSSASSSRSTLADLQLADSYGFRHNKLRAIMMLGLRAHRQQGKSG
jgi:hypothetical protein